MNVRVMTGTVSVCVCVSIGECVAALYIDPFYDLVA